jgi:hypothetical protein
MRPASPPAPASLSQSLSDRIRGAVRSRDDNGNDGAQQQQQQQQQQQPLRVLVVGDSLAAGIGQDPASVLPVLPQSIAASLSQHMRGRPVYWTCVGSPGMSATEVVEVIHHELPRLRFPAFVSKLAEWQESRRIEAAQRLNQIQSTAAQRWDSLRKRTWTWVSHIGRPVDDDSTVDDVTGDGETGSIHSDVGESNDASSNGRPLPKSLPLEGAVQWARKRLLRVKRGIERDLRNFLQVLAPSPSLDSREDEGEDDGGGGDNAVASERADRTHRNSSEEEAHSTAQRVRRMVSKHNLDPEFVNQYDVAIVLTGINDLKDAFLPFMMSPQRLKKLEASRLQRQRKPPKDIDFGKDEDDVDNDDDGASCGDAPGGGRVGVFQGELLRIVEALRDTVVRKLPAAVADGAQESSPSAPPSQSEAAVRSLPLPASSNSDTSTTTTTSGLDDRTSRHRKGPLIVFPALPLEPIELSQRAPLSWFVVPIVRGMDRNKQRLSELHPDTVLFVPSPPSDVFEDAENRRGILWEATQRETVLLKLADISRTVRRRFQSLLLDDPGAGDATAASDGHENDGRAGPVGMVEHEDACTASLYELCEDGVVLVQRRLDGAAQTRPRHPGSTMVSDDGIHPNDRGYEVWGKFIARAIVEHWEREQRAAA